MHLALRAACRLRKTAVLPFCPQPIATTYMDAGSAGVVRNVHWPAMGFTGNCSCIPSISAIHGSHSPERRDPAEGLSHVTTLTL